MRIAVAGGTGTVGRHVVQALRASGHEPVVLARSAGVDLRDGAGLAGALAGASAVVDVTAYERASAPRSVKFYRTVTGNLLAAEQSAGVRHHVALSIVAAARLGISNYAGKKAQEEMVAAAPTGWSILRATQFHEFVRHMYALGRIGPISFAPKLFNQPVAAAEVGAVLAEIAVGEPRGFDTEMAGPRQERMATMVRRYARANGEGRPVFEVPWPGALGRAMRDGTLLPDPGARRGRQTFQEWLTEQHARNLPGEALRRDTRRASGK